MKHTFSEDEIGEMLNELEDLRDREQGYLTVQRSHLSVIAALEKRVAELEAGRFVVRAAE